MTATIAPALPIRPQAPVSRNCWNAAYNFALTARHSGKGPQDVRRLAAECERIGLDLGPYFVPSVVAAMRATGAS
jgi:hypothetical protein